MTTPLNILSLGAGVQSTVLLLMSCRGELPKLDHAIFSDTQWEPGEVYTHLEWLKGEASAAGIPLTVVTKGNLREHVVEGFSRRSLDHRVASIPVRVLNDDGSDGMIRRQCTREYKIEPIERFIKTEILGLDVKGRWPKTVVVNQWFGITSDELRRVRMPQSLWKDHCYPFVQMPDMGIPVMDRQACVHWLAENYPDRHIPRSACIGCPFRSNREWRWIRDHYPAEWADAIEVDEAIRHADGMNGTVYLHRDCVPLKDADLGDDTDQMQFGFNQECLGYCGS